MMKRLEQTSGTEKVTNKFKMTLLEWMHRKLTQKTTEKSKCSAIGNLSVCFSVPAPFHEQNNYVESMKTMSHANIMGKKSSNGFEANNLEMLPNEQSFEPFDFLAIGTFGIELVNTDPPTPTLPETLEKFTDQWTEVTENGPRLIKYEMEKFLDAEETDKVKEASESTLSIIIQSNEPTEGVQMVACPLQKYLFVASTELPSQEINVQKEKTFLEAHFERHDMVYHPILKDEGAEEKSTRKNVAHFMKKLVHKLHSPSCLYTDASKNDAGAATKFKKRFSKVKRMLHKKVHPEERNNKDFAEFQKGKKTSSYEDYYEIKNDKENVKFARDDASTVHGRIEHWIKTDSNYLILEL